MERKNKRVLLGILIVSSIVAIISISYAFINIRLAGEKKQVLSAGDLSLELDEDINNLTIEDALPMYDEVGMIQTPFTFRVVNNSNVPLSYILRLVDITTREKLDTSIVKYDLTKENADTIDFLSNLENGQVDNGIISSKQTIHYSLRLWIDVGVEDNTLIKNKCLSYRIEIEASQLDGAERTITLNSTGGVLENNTKSVIVGEPYGELPIPTKTDSKFLGWYTEKENGEKIENTSIVEFREQQVLYAHWKEPYTDNTGASRPVIKDELIPVKIASNGEVTKADIYEEWYDYDKQNWANVVILLDKTKSYIEGQEIPESNIESYFVWIPRFKYKIFNTGNYNGLTNIESREQTIEVQFEDKNTAPSNGTTVGSWLSHPAFTAFDSNGFWVGKFESGYKGATSTTAAEVNSYDSTKLIIKPNTYSWRNITVGNAFKVSYDYARNLESHMMKNTEWGAVAYLQHSKYGSRQSVRINNNNSFKTGYSNIEEPTLGYNKGLSIKGNLNGISLNVTQPYNTATGYLASTTGNIHGIYDMSGGAWEYVMGYNTKADRIGGESEITSLYSDFFTNEEWNKYYDKYQSTQETDYYNQILGDATGEMGPFGSVVDPDEFARYRTSWYGDYGYFPLSNSPWVTRGANWIFGIQAGIFGFSYRTGCREDNGSFRIILTP